MNEDGVELDSPPLQQPLPPPPLENMAPRPSNFADFFKEAEKRAATEREEEEVASITPENHARQDTHKKEKSVIKFG